MKVSPNDAFAPMAGVGVRIKEPSCPFHGPMVLKEQENGPDGSATLLYACITNGERCRWERIRLPAPKLPPRPVNDCDDCERKFGSSDVVWEVKRPYPEPPAHYCLKCYEKRFWASTSWAPSTTVPKRKRSAR